MKALLVLADAGEAVEGKVSALGAGWSVTSAPTPPMSLLVFIDCPWDQTNTRHRLTIELVDADGRPVALGQGPVGQPQTLRIDAEFEAGRPPGVAPGTPIRHTLAIGIGPLPLAPDSKYEFRMTIDGELADSWLATFSTRPVVPMPPAYP